MSNDIELANEAGQDQEQDNGGTSRADERTCLFRGDTGQLPQATRRVLTQLLVGPSVDGMRQAKLWPVLLRDETVLRSRLHDLFLGLVVDRDHKVAFARQLSEEGVDMPILLRRANLTFLESALVLFLRSRLIQAESSEDRAVVAMHDMVEHLRVYEQEVNNDKARFERQVQAAVEKAKSLNLLYRLKGPEDRFEVSPTLKLLFSAEEIAALTKTYQKLAQGATADGTASEGAATEGASNGDAESADTGEAASNEAGSEENDEIKELA